MMQSRVMGRAASQDWLPWALSIFVASCAVFVLVRGVLPARSENAELTQQIARLERDLTAANQVALEQKATVARAAQAAPAAASAPSSDGAARAAARKEFSQSLEPELASGAVLLEDRQQELVVDIMSEVIFDPGRADVSRKGRKFLKEVAATMKRLPAAQVYQIGGHTDRGRNDEGNTQHHPADWKLSALRAASVARALEDAGVAGEQLIAAGFSGYRAPSNARASTGPKHPRIEIVLLKDPR